MPESVALPPLTTWKTRKFPLLAVMVSVAAPGPVIASVPAVDAEAIVGNPDPSVIVPAPPANSDEAKTIVSASADALADVIASRSVVKASLVVLSASESTVIVASTRRDSSISPAASRPRATDRRTRCRCGKGLSLRRPGKKVSKGI